MMNLDLCRGWRPILMAGVLSTVCVVPSVAETPNGEDTKKRLVEDSCWRVVWLGIERRDRSTVESEGPRETSQLPGRSKGGVQHPRFYLRLAGVYQPTSIAFGQRSADLIQHAEQGRFGVSYQGSRGFHVDLAGGAYLRPHWRLGVSVTRFSRADPAGIIAQVPHPFFFERPREVRGDSSGMRRQEVAFHMQASWVESVSEHVELAISGGPSLFNVRQELVSDLTVRESYPYEEAELAGTLTHRQTRTRLGYNVGADVTYRLTPHLGIGALVRFSRASVRFSSASESISSDAGGLHTGLGLHLRF